MVLGGATVREERYIWLDFVSSTSDRIEGVKNYWKAGNRADGPLKSPSDDDAEHIPITPEPEQTLPNRKPVPSA